LVSLICCTDKRELNLSSGVVNVSGSIRKGVWHYYPMQLTGSSKMHLVFILNVISITAPLTPTFSLYLQRDVFPQVDSYSHAITCQSTTFSSLLFSSFLSLLLMLTCNWHLLLFLFR
jgi:hypothetical protein